MWTILRSRASRYSLDALREHDVPVFVLHGAWDLAVPHRTARDTVARTDGVLITIERAGYSWILRDPETLPAVMNQLMDGEVGKRCRRRLRAAGLRKKQPTVAEIEQVCYEPDARVFTLTPHREDAEIPDGRHHRPHYRWTVATG